MAKALDYGFMTVGEYQKNNVFRTPDWRHRRLERLDGKRATVRDDKRFIEAKNYLSVLQYAINQEDEAAVERAWMRNPDLFYAYQMHRHEVDTDNPDSLPAAFVQARILAWQDDATIAKLMGTTPGAINWYEYLYFNIREYLECRDWITSRILVPALTRVVPVSGNPQALMAFDSEVKNDIVSKPAFDGCVKLFCYFGRAHVADLLLNLLPVGKPMNSPEDFKNWSDGIFMTTLRRRAMLASVTFGVNKYNVNQLFDTYQRIIDSDRSSENVDSQRTSLERHVKAFVDEVPWLFGEAAERLSEGTKLGEYDKMSAELRDEETIMVAAGHAGPNLDDVPKEFPPPRRPLGIADKKGEL